MLAEAAAAFGLLAAPARLHIVWALAQGESDVTGLAERVGGTLPSVSQHLTKLKLAGLVRSRREGRRQVYLVDDPDVVTVVRLMVGQLAARAGHPSPRPSACVNSVPESSPAAGPGHVTIGTPASVAPFPGTVPTPLQTLRSLGSGPRGLLEAEAETRLARTGENVLPARRPVPGPAVFCAASGTPSPPYSSAWVWCRPSLPPGAPPASS